MAREEKRQRELLGNIRMRIERRAEIMVLQAYRDVVAERVHMRKVLKQILAMWIDKGRRAGFRSLWLYATRRRRHRELVAEGLLRVVRSRSKRALLGFRINRDQEVRVRVVLARIRWRPAAVALELWNKVVMDVIYAQQRALAAKSPIIARFLKRAMVEAFAEWHTLAAEAARHLRIIKRMRMRVVYAAAIAALQQWAVYMEDMVQERHEELVSCAQTALTNGDLRPLEQTLARHFKVPHVRRKYKAQSMREVVAEVLANGGASHGTLALLSAQSLEYHDDDEHWQAPSGAAYAAAGPRDEGTSDPCHRVCPPVPPHLQLHHYSPGEKGGRGEGGRGERERNQERRREGDRGESATRKRERQPGIERESKGKETDGGRSLLAPRRGTHSRPPPRTKVYIHTNWLHACAQTGLAYSDLKLVTNGGRDQAMESVHG